MRKVFYLFFILLSLNTANASENKSLSPYVKAATEKFLAKAQKKKNNTKNNNKNSNKANNCQKPKANLVVVNFTPVKLTVFVDGKKVGNVPALDQKSLKQTLPVGSPLVQVSNASKLSAESLATQEVLTVANEGKKTCKNSFAVLVGQ